MSFRIGSFNIQKFSRQSVFRGGSGESRKDLDILARIIRDNEFDIIAIQEIFHPIALKELLESVSGQYADQLKRGSIDMGSFNLSGRTNDSWGYRTKHWEGRWAKPRSDYGDTVAEGYAFIWNRDRVKLVANREGKSFEPRIADYSGTENLVRPPFVGRFMPINGSYEMRLINTHIVYAAPAKQLDDDEDQEETATDTNDIDLRKQEFNTLTQQIYADFADMVFDKTGHDRDARPLVAYTFLLGDFNLNLSNSISKSSAKFDDTMQAVSVRGKNVMCLITVNNKLTTLRGKPRNEEARQILMQDPLPEHHLKNNYDHFTFDIRKLAAHDIAIPEDGVISAYSYFTDTNMDTKYDLYKQKISDHLPIYLDFDVRKRL